MRIPEELADCVFFLEVETPDGPSPIGTGFLIHDQRQDIRGIMVTARHVVEPAIQLGRKISARFTASQSTAVAAGAESATIRFVIAPEEWTFGDVTEEADDVAVAFLHPLAPTMAQIRVIGTAVLATEALLKHHEIDVGDEVLVAGLFVMHYGTNRNLPIYRLGHIAGMPHEPIKTKIGNLRAYLLETRSIGGLSGSPVFVHLGGFMRLPPGTQLVSDGSGVHGNSQAVMLLGMIHGHYSADVPLTEPDSMDGVDPGDLVNMGIALAVPTSRIMAAVERLPWPMPTNPPETHDT